MHGRGLDIGRIGGALIATTCGCWTKPSNPPPPHIKPIDAALVHEGPSSEARARSIIDAQLAAARGSTYDNHSALTATFAPDAVIIASDDIAKAEDYVGRQLQGLHGEPGTIDRLVADGNPRVVWFYAELKMHGISGDYVIRMSELTAAVADWKVVAAAITQVRPIQPTGNVGVIDHPTSAGPLTSLLLDGAASPLAIGADAVTAVGADATAPLIASFVSLHPIVGAVVPREVRTADYGFAQVGVDLDVNGYHSHALGQVFAIPALNQSWRIVLVQYIGE